MLEAALRVLLVEDETLALRRLRRLVDNAAHAAGVRADVAAAVNGIEAIALIERFEPELVFLDIQMPGLSGFDVLRQAKPRHFKVVFTTAFDAFAVRAFEENACDYLLKPFTEQRFAQAFARALAHKRDGGPITGLAHQLLREERYMEKLLIRERRSVRVIALASVSCFISRDHCTLVYLGQEELICDLSLAHLEAQIDPRRFQRIHRRHLVRRDAVVALHVGPPLLAELDNGMRIAVSRKNRGFLRET